MVGRYARLSGLSGQDARRERLSRGSGTRTRGLSVPNAARYQAALCPGAGCGSWTHGLVLTKDALYR